MLLLCAAVSPPTNTIFGSPVNTVFSHAEVQQIVICWVQTEGSVENQERVQVMTDIECLCLGIHQFVPAFSDWEEDSFDQHRTTPVGEADLFWHSSVPRITQEDSKWLAS